jgi:hypothetical protein
MTLHSFVHCQPLRGQRIYSHLRRLSNILHFSRA